MTTRLRSESHVASIRRKLGMIDHRSLVSLAAEFRSQRPVSASPQEASSFVGRLAELREVTNAVTASRVVTVVGAGGTGRTRLAVRAARDLSVGTSRLPVWVDLATEMSPSEVTSTLATALGVVEPGRRTHEQAVNDVLGQPTALLVLETASAHLGSRAMLYLTGGDALPFDDDVFDLVTTSMVLHEVPGGERVPLVTEMARVAKPDGSLLFTDFQFGSLRGWKGSVLRAVSEVIERLSGHYSEYRSFKASGGVPSVIFEAGLGTEREKIVAGGNVAIYAVTPTP